MLADQEIVALFWNRDESAIREAEKRYENCLLSLCYRLLGNRQDAEECKNDTYLAAWNRIPPERPRQLLGYLSGIARHISVSRYRENTRQKRVPSILTESLEDWEGLLCDGNSTEAALDRKELTALIRRFLMAQPARNRQIFICRYYWAFTVGEIARRLHMRERTVYAVLQTMREQLAAVLKKEGY